MTGGVLFGLLAMMKKSMEPPEDVFKTRENQPNNQTLFSQTKPDQTKLNYIWSTDLNQSQTPPWSKPNWKTCRRRRVENWCIVRGLNEINKLMKSLRNLPWFNLNMRSWTVATYAGSQATFSEWIKYRGSKYICVLPNICTSSVMNHSQRWCY